MKLAVELLLVACAIALFTDLRQHRIPNWLTAVLAAGGLALHIPQGWSAVGIALAAGSSVFIFGAVARSMGVLGGGDVKLLAAGALTLGFPDCVLFVLATLLGGGFFAIAFALAQHRLHLMLANVRAMVRTRTFLDETAPTSARMPYGVAIGFGAVVVALADTIFPAMRFLT